jgi:hypothetical protein
MGKEELIEKLSGILSLLDFDEEAKEDALNYIPAHYGFISKASGEACSLEKKNHHERLMILIFKMIELMDMYKEKDIPEEVMFDTLSDVSLRQRMYFENHGRIGITEKDAMWLKQIYKMEIFKLGALQFEISHMECLNWKGIRYYEGAFERIPEGEPVLNVHIQKGVDFSREEVDKSFERAESFFEKYFPEHDFVAYTCNSWLLYPGNNIILPPSSNILDFANRFELIGEADNKEFALEYIFGRYGVKQDYPQKTSLQVNALKNINKLGAGFGFLSRSANKSQKNYLSDKKIIA